MELPLEDTTLVAKQETRSPPVCILFVSEQINGVKKETQQTAAVLENFGFGI